MDDKQWEQLRSYLSHSGLTSEQIIEAVKAYQTEQVRKSKEYVEDVRQTSLFT